MYTFLYKVESSNGPLGPFFIYKFGGNMNKIVVVGLGLIGGSIVKGLKNHAFEVYGIDTDQTIVNTCYEQGLIVNKDLSHNCLKEADIVFVCLYPEIAMKYLKAHQMFLKPGAIVTDVIGLKVWVMEEVKSFIRHDIHFIGGHPMAGKEGQGFSVSDAAIFNHTNYLLVVDPQTPYNCVERLKQIIFKLGCKRVEILDATSHDDMIAYTSHMPHILSTVFMNCDRFNHTKNCVAGSFRDLTRVSNINALLWSQLIMENKEPVLNEIKIFKEMLESIEFMIKNDDIGGVTSFLEKAKVKKLKLGPL